jgi:hypothetical protein
MRYSCPPRSGGPSPAMIDTFAKEYLHEDLREIRQTMLWKLDGLSEYDIRRPLTSTGTNLLGLVKHLSHTEARYFGDVFGRPFAERLPWWDDDAEADADLWVTEAETNYPEWVVSFAAITCRDHRPLPPCLGAR